MSLLFAPENTLFLGALAMLAGICLVEVLALLIGFADLAGAVDDLIDVDDFTAGEGSLSQLLSWLNVGRVPVLILLIVFLACFGLTGISVQFLSSRVGLGILPGGIAALPALLVSVPLFKMTGSTLAKILPKDESSVVSRSHFVGRVATITVGTARQGNPAEAKLKDEHGLTHYVMVEPDDEAGEFRVGESVLIVNADGSICRAIPSPAQVLV